LDSNNYISLKQEELGDDLDNKIDEEIDEILKDLENDPELQIEEEEIKKMISGIDEKADKDLFLDIDNIKDVKEKFQSR
jgi:hypothetical protein